MGRIRAWISTAQTRLWAQTENRFLFLLPVVGVLVGLISAGTAHLIAFLQKQFWGSGTNLLGAAEGNPWFLRLAIPVVGGLIVGAIGWVFKVKTRGGGVTTIIQAVGLKGGTLSLRATVPRDWAAMMTIATGGSLGREGAMAMLASATASSLGRRFQLSTQQLRVLVCAASAAALASVYNAPIGGSLFALEIVMGSFALEVLGPVIVSSVISTLVFRSCMGNLPRFEIPRYEFVSGWELGFYLVLGILAGLTAWLFVRSLFASQDLFEKLPLPRWLKPAIGMALVGTIGIWWPHVFGNGFEALNLTLREQFPWQLLATLLAMKVLASALTFGSGGAGGLFTPSLMVGALLGGAFGYGVHAAFPTITADYGAYALVGMGGVLAGMTHAPLTAIMMVFEQTNSYQIVLPLMFVCVISQVTVRLLKSRSMEEESLIRRGIQFPRGPESSIMQTIAVRDVMHEAPHAIPHNAHFADIVERFLKEPLNNLYVVDDTGRYLGAIRLHSLKEMLHQAETLTTVIARDLVDDTFPFLTPDQRLADTMEIFWREHAERIPVLDNATSRRLLGWLSKRDLFGIYSQEILRKRQLLGRFTVHDDDGARDIFVELPEGYQLSTITIPTLLHNRTIADLAIRSHYNLHALQIKRRDPATGRTHIQIATADTPLLDGDQLTVIGPAEGLADFELSIYSTADEQPPAA